MIKIGNWIYKVKEISDPTQLFDESLKSIESSKYIKSCMKPYQDPLEGLQDQDLNQSNDLDSVSREVLLDSPDARDQLKAPLKNKYTILDLITL